MGLSSKAFRQYKEVLTADLVKYHSNSRTHSDEQIEQIVRSINEFGFTNPLLIDENNTIIAGHGRLEAALKLGLDELPCIVIDGLSEAQRAALIIADNKLALNAGWDNSILVSQFEFLKGFDFDLSLTGFGVDELCDIFPDELPEAFCDEDECPDVPEEPITKIGDVWLLGDHRLMCGDSTSINAVEKLMNGVKADMVFTDPPYNVAFNGRSGKFDVIANDDLDAKDFESFIGSIASIITAIDAPYYIWCNWKFYGLLQSLLPFTACIVWAKNNFGLGNGYRHQHEFCLTNAKIDKDVKSESDLWKVSKDAEYVHPTQKPVALAERAIGNHKTSKAVLDLFGGSGSTLIACEKLRRKCYMMELDVKYCDVIVKRWEQYTGKKAVLEVRNDH